MIDCEKEMITDVGDFSNTWSGRNAKWYECSTSQAGGEITLFDWDLTDSYSEVPVIGGTEIDESGCFKFTDWVDANGDASWAPNLFPYVKMAATAVGLEIPDFENLAEDETFTSKTEQEQFDLF